MNHLAQFLDRDLLKAASSKSVSQTIPSFHSANGRSLAVGALIVSALIFQGCASSALNRKIDREVAEENAIKTHADLRNEAGQLIQTAPGLTDEQRSQLSALRDATRAELDAMWAQSLKLRSVLIKDLITTNYNTEEVELIKGRIRDVEAKRLAITFGAIEKANQILGRAPEANRQRIMDAFFEGHGGSRD